MMGGALCKITIPFPVCRTMIKCENKMRKQNAKNINAGNQVQIPLHD